MERTSNQSSPGLRPRELIDIARIEPSRGPFTSVVLETVSETENAAQKAMAVWRAAREKLVAAGAGESVLAEIEDLVPGAHLSGDALGIVADKHGVRRVEHFPSVGGPEVCRVAALPVITRMLLWRQRLPLHVVVLADRRGADLLTFRWGRTPLFAEAGDADWPIAKNQPGGWSQRKFQNRAEKTWEHNAHEVAGKLVRLTARESPAFIALGGDVRAVELIEKSLPGDVAGLVRRLSAGRAPDGSEDVLNGEVEELLVAQVAAVEEDMVTTFADLLGQSLALTGVGETLTALAEGRVDTLLVHDDSRDDRTASFSEDPGLVSARREDLEVAGATKCFEGRVVDVAVRAAFGTSASVYVLEDPHALQGGVGAILRWPEPG